MKKPEILIVDDDAIIAEDLTMKVTEMGYSGVSVDSGKEAIKKISPGYEPDLILMDVTLRDENGIQTARTIQKSRRIPVIFVTALPHKTVLEDSKDLVSTGYIQKPISKKELQDCIRQLLAAA